MKIISFFEIIVLYPFEVEWYKQQGVEVSWLGNPIYERTEPFFALADKEKKTWENATNHHAVRVIR